MSAIPPQTVVNIDALVKRYKDAYTIATFMVTFGAALKTLAHVFGVIIFTVGGAALSSSWTTPIPIRTVWGIGGAIFGILVWLFFFVLGVIASCQGQVLRANLDEAVYVCPFFTDANKIIAANLPTSRNA